MPVFRWWRQKRAKSQVEIENRQQEARRAQMAELQKAAEANKQFAEADRKRKAEESRGTDLKQALAALSIDKLNFIARDDTQKGTGVRSGDKRINISSEAAWDELNRRASLREIEYRENSRIRDARPISTERDERSQQLRKELARLEDEGRPDQDEIRSSCR